MMNHTSENASGQAGVSSFAEQPEAACQEQKIRYISNNISNLGAKVVAADIRMHDPVDIASVAKKGVLKFYAIKDWNTFQHYRHRSPPWIKLHRSLLDDYSFCSLRDDQKAHLMLLWLYASQNNGRVPDDVPFLERKLSITGLDLSVFASLGFLVLATDEGRAGK